MTYVKTKEKGDMRSLPPTPLTERVHKYQPPFWPIVNIYTLQKKWLPFFIQKCYEYTILSNFQQKMEFWNYEIPTLIEQTLTEITPFKQENKKIIKN